MRVCTALVERHPAGTDVRGQSFAAYLGQVRPGIAYTVSPS